MAVKYFHIAQQNDGNSTLTFKVNIPKGKTKEQEQILVLTAALEATGYDGVYAGAGMDDPDIK